MTGLERYLLYCVVVYMIVDAICLVFGIGSRGR